MLGGETITINGDGETSRDFCFVANAVQANLLAALAPDEAQGDVFNVAVGERTTLNQLFDLLRGGLERHGRRLLPNRPTVRSATATSATAKPTSPRRGACSDTPRPMILPPA